MKISLFVFGKTDISYIQQGIQEYEKRISFFCPFEVKTIVPSKNHGRLSPAQQLHDESILFTSKITPNDLVFLLDEKGKTYSSMAFAEHLEQWLSSGKKQLIFIVGGAYGFDASFKQKYPTLSLSPMTFNHQLARLVFVEQLYRAFTIIKGLPYHNE